MDVDSIGKMIINLGKPNEFFVSALPVDSVDFQILEKIDPLEFDLKSDDFLIWDAMPWLTQDSFKLVLFGVIYASSRQSIKSGLCIDAIIDSLSGADQTSDNPDYWVHPFTERWTKLTSKECGLVNQWLEYLMGGCKDSEMINSLNKSKAIIAQLASKEIGRVINL